MDREVLNAILESYKYLVAEIGGIKKCLLELKSAMQHKNMLKVPQSRKRVESRINTSKSSVCEGVLVSKDADEHCSKYKKYEKDDFSRQRSAGGKDFHAVGLIPFSSKETGYCKKLEGGLKRSTTLLGPCRALANEKPEGNPKAFSKHGSQHLYSKSRSGQEMSANPDFLISLPTVYNPKLGSMTNKKSFGICATLAQAGPRFKRISRVQEVYQVNRSSNSYKGLFPVLEKEIKKALNY